MSSADFTEFGASNNMQDRIDGVFLPSFSARHSQYSRTRMLALSRQRDQERVGVSEECWQAIALKRTPAG